MELNSLKEKVEQIFLYWNNNHPIGDDKWSKDIALHIDKVKGSKKTTLRFLDAKIINFANGKPYCCRFCTMPTYGSAVYWHKLCWEAVEPYTAKYWRRIVSKKRRLKKSKLCANCGVSGRHQADHILPVALGGKSTYDNLQFLCKSCHKNKTAIDMQAIREHKKGVFENSSSNFISGSE